MGIMEWLLVWLIVNALFFVWRILVTTEVEIPDRSIRKMPNVADLRMGNGPSNGGAGAVIPMCQSGGDGSSTELNVPSDRPDAWASYCERRPSGNVVPLSRK